LGSFEDRAATVLDNDDAGGRFEPAISGLTGRKSPFSIFMFLLNLNVFLFFLSAI